MQTRPLLVRGTLARPRRISAVRLGTRDARCAWTPLLMEAPMALEKQLNLSDIILIAMTRGMLGAGLGLLLAGKLTREQRVAVGRTLMAIGAVTTLPLAWRV